ncbi:unnamed protein product [Prunus armeniaca]
MLVFVPETRLIDIFLHHEVDSNEDWFYSQSRSNLFVDLEVDIVPNRGVVIEELDGNYVVIEELDGNYGAIVPVEFNEDPNGEQSGGGTQKARESCARWGVSEKGKEKAVERESSAVQTVKEKAVERESYTLVDKGKSKVNSVFGKRRARAFGKRRCKNVKKTCDKEDQRSNTVTEGLVENEVVEAIVEKSKLLRCHSMKTRKARKRTTVYDDEESANSLDSNFADPNFNCDDCDDDVDFDEWVDKHIEWVGDGAKGKEPDSTNAKVESWDWDADVELDSEEHDFDNVHHKYDSDDDTPMKDRWPELNPATDMGDPQFEVGMKLNDCNVFRSAVKEQFIKMNRDVVFMRSEAFKIKAIYANLDCP